MSIQILKHSTSNKTSASVKASGFATRRQYNGWHVFFGVFYAIASVCVFCGCTHFHDRNNEELAKEALQNFNDFKKASGGPYGSMLRNHVQMDAASAAFQAEVANIRRKTITASLAAKTWSTIQTELQDAAKQQQIRLENLGKDLEELFGKQSEAKDSADRVTKSLALAKQKLDEVSREQQKWEARQILFLSAIKMSAECVATTNKSDLPALKKSGADALNQTVIVERFDKDGKLTTITNKVSAILMEDADLIKEGNLANILRNYTYDLFDPSAAPGLKVTIFSLGVDLAQKQLERAKLEVTYLQEEIAVAKEKQRMLTDNESIDIPTALTNLSDRSTELVPSDEVLSTLEHLRPTQRNAGAIKDAFSIIATYASIECLNESRWNESETRAAFVEHEHSIKLSAINAAEHEALISRGLQALVIYHNGGLTEERIANFLRIAQTAAMAYIGAQVN
jgi:hypothetical protein